MTLDETLLVSTIVAAILTAPFVAARALRRRQARDREAVLRVLSESNVPLRGDEIARRAGLRMAYSTLADLEERGLVERIVDPPVTRTVYGSTYLVHGLTWYRLADPSTDAGMVDG